MGGWGVANLSFSRIFGFFFILTRPLSTSLYINQQFSTKQVQCFCFRIDFDSSKNYWIGLDRTVVIQSESTDWTWETGSAYSWTDWASDEPSSGDSCAFVYSYYDDWYSGSCDTSRKCLCQRSK